MARRPRLGMNASRDRGLQAPNGVPANHTRNQSPRPQAAASSPLVVHSVPTARPSAVDNQGLAWVGGGGWGRRTQCGRPDTSGGCPARPQWARHAIERGRGPDHSIGARSVAPRLWTAPLTKVGLGRHRPRAGAGRFAAVAKTVCARPVEGRTHTGGWVNPLSGCAHCGRVALARQLSPCPVASPCPQRLAPPCARTRAMPAGHFS